MKQLTAKKTVVKQRHYSVAIHHDNTGFVVRKYEIIFGILVPIDETYVLNIDDALWMQNLWINQLNGFSLN